MAGGYGAPAQQICASKVFGVSIGDDNKKILVGNQVE